MPKAYELMDAIDKADIDTVRACLADSTLDLNYISRSAGSSGQSPLMRAIGVASTHPETRDIREEIALLIIDSPRANIDFCSPSGYGAIHKAAEVGSERLMSAVLNKAAEQKLDVTKLANSPCKRSDDSLSWDETPLYMAACRGNSAAVPLLIKAGAAVNNAQNGRRHNETALIGAIQDSSKAKASAADTIRGYAYDLKGPNTWPILTEPEIEERIQAKMSESTAKLKGTLTKLVEVVGELLDKGADPLPAKAMLDSQHEDKSIALPEDKFKQMLTDAAAHHSSAPAGAGADIKSRLKATKAGDDSTEETYRPR